jgi:HlyD family secretion protein
VPVVQLADVSNWQIETDDLTELSIVRVSVGDAVAITFDAIPDLELAGKVVRIKSFGENKQGDITYTVIIQPNQQDERLRWNMTASVAIEPK